MPGKFTLTILKPDAVRKGYVGLILSKISEAKFKIRALKMTAFTIEDARKFYDVHRERPFYDSLTIFMSSAPIVAAVLEKENAVRDFRTLIGATDPEKANQDTIRRIYAESIEENVVHGSDNDESALKEIAFFFTPEEIFLSDGKSFLF